MLTDAHSSLINSIGEHSRPLSDISKLLQAIALLPDARKEFGNAQSRSAFAKFFNAYIGKRLVNDLLVFGLLFVNSHSLE